MTVRGEMSRSLCHPRRPRRAPASTVRPRPRRLRTCLRSCPARPPKSARVPRAALRAPRAPTSPARPRPLVAFHGDDPNRRWDEGVATWRGLRPVRRPIGRTDEEPNASGGEGLLAWKSLSRCPRATSARTKKGPVASSRVAQRSHGRIGRGRGVGGTQATGRVAAAIRRRRSTRACRRFLQACPQLLRPRRR
jgi:hypothetical protein